MSDLPLTAAEHVQLDALIRRGAGRLTPDERGRFLRLWDRHRADDAQARRTLGGLTAKVQRLTALATDYEQVVRSQRAEILASTALPADR